MSPSSLAIVVLCWRGRLYQICSRRSTTHLQAVISVFIGLHSRPPSPKQHRPTHPPCELLSSRPPIASNTVHRSAQSSLATVEFGRHCPKVLEATVITFGMELESTLSEEFAREIIAYCRKIWELRLRLSLYKQNSAITTIDHCLWPLLSTSTTIAAPPSALPNSPIARTVLLIATHRKQHRSRRHFPLLPSPVCPPLSPSVWNWRAPCRRNFPKR